MLETSFAHCSSTMLRRGRGKKHKIVQIAVFSIIFVSDCSRIWQKFTNYISCFSLLGIFSAHKTNYYTDTHKHTNTLTHVKTYMHTDILTYAYTHTQPNIHSPKHTLIHPYRLKFCLIPIFNLQLELVLIKFFTKRCHCPLRLSLHFSYGDCYYSLYFWQFTRHPPSFLWHFLIVSTKCTNSNQHNPYLMARSSLSLFKWQLLISAIFLFTFRFDDYLLLVCHNANPSIFFCPLVLGLVSLKLWYLTKWIQSPRLTLLSHSLKYIHFSLYYFVPLRIGSYHFPLPSPLMPCYAMSNSLCWRFFCILQQCSLQSHDNHQIIDTFHFQSGL